MSRLTRIRHEFVTYAPGQLEPGVAYVSMEYATVIHLCCCGCGSQVVTPLKPARWHLSFDGESISLDPSVGNWSFSCQSHYWIEGNQVIWDRPFSHQEIDSVRRRDRLAIEESHAPELADVAASSGPQPSWRERLRRFLFG